METDKADLVTNVVIEDGYSSNNSGSPGPEQSDPNSSPMRTLPPRYRSNAAQPQGQGASGSNPTKLLSNSATSTPRRSPVGAPSVPTDTMFSTMSGNPNLPFSPASVASGVIESIGCTSSPIVPDTQTWDSIISKGTIGSRPRADSEHYYGEASISIPGKSLQGEMKGYNLKQSKQLPYCLWFMLAKSLGIKLHENDKPWFGTLLYILTLTFALMFAATNIWYLVFDIISVTTRQTVLTGGVEIVIVLGWSALGVYANSLAYKLFTNRNMVQSVRMHSKTIFKMNSSGLMAILAIVFITLNNYDNFEEFYVHTCRRLGVNEWVCHFKFTSRVGHSIFTVLWNLLVGVVILSVCRTHTIGVRRFIRDLEEDGLVYIQYTREVVHHGHGRIEDILHNFGANIESPDDGWDEITVDDDTEVECDQENLFNYSTTSSRRRRSSHCSPLRRHSESARPRHLQGLDNPPVIKILDGSDHSAGSPGDMPTEGTSVETNPSMVNLVIPDPPSQISQVSGGSSNQESATSTKVELGSPRQMPSPDSTEYNMSVGQEQFQMMPNCFSTEDILLSYWKILYRLRTTSRIMQRWLASWISFIIFWNLTYIIYWLNHQATFIGIAEFVIPLLLLPLVCSAYAEVNFEGHRMLRCICPTESRLWMLYYMNLQPLRMTLYGFTVSYQAIISVVGAVGLAFATKVILDEVNI